MELFLYNSLFSAFVFRSALLLSLMVLNMIFVLLNSVQNFQHHTKQQHRKSLCMISEDNICLPIELARHLYQEWDSEVALINEPSNIYAKTLDGEATITFKNGNTYIGMMARGLLHGKGTFKWPNGIVYTGQFTNNRITGKGKYIWPDGSTYEGDVVNGVKEGFGKFTSSLENAVYTGEWRDGKRNGKGKIEYANGSIFEGSFKDGKKSGEGKMTYTSGNYYEGNWVDDIKQGYGCMMWVAVNEMYKGNWVNNKQNGHGTHVWLEAKAEFKVLKNRYEGNWVDGKRKGFGTFFYSNGSKYEGYWDNNMKEGYGIMTQENGDIKLGFFKMDRLIKSHSVEEEKAGLKPSVHLAVNQQNTANTGGLAGSASGNILPPIKELGAAKQLGELKKVGKLPSRVKKQASDKSQLNNSLNISKDAISSLAPALSPTAPLTSIVPSGIRAKQVEENPYFKYIDIQNFHVPESILNFLLRSHSTLKNWYKQFSFTHNDNYSGMSLADWWRLLKEAKLIDARCTPANIDRQFSKGHRSYFDLSSSGKDTLQLFLKYPNTKCDEVDELGIRYHSTQLYNCKDKLESLQNEPFDPSKLRCNKSVRNIHDPNQLILFRHFATLLVRLAKMKYCWDINENSIPSTNPNMMTPYERELKAALEKLFARISHIVETKDAANISSYKEHPKIVTQTTTSMNIQNTSLKSNNLMINKVVLDWAKTLNQKLFNRITADQRHIIGHIDKTVTVRQTLRLFERINLLKEPFEKMAFLEKTEKFFDCKHYYFKKELKQHAALIISNLDKSDILRPILEYELNSQEFTELVYLTLVKKVTGGKTDPEEMKSKYEEAVEAMIRVYEESLQPKPFVSMLKRKVVLTEKDLAKQELLRRLEEERLRKLQEEAKQKEREREDKQREVMEMNDINIVSDQEIEDEEDDFD